MEKIAKQNGKTVKNHSSAPNTPRKVKTSTNVSNTPNGGVATTKIGVAVKSTKTAPSTMSLKSSPAKSVINPHNDLNQHQTTKAAQPNNGTSSEKIEAPAPEVTDTVLSASTTPLASLPPLIPAVSAPVTSTTPLPLSGVGLPPGMAHASLKKSHSSRSLPLLHLATIEEEHEDTRKEEPIFCSDLRSKSVDVGFGDVISRNEEVDDVVGFGGDDDIKDEGDNQFESEIDVSDVDNKGTISKESSIEIGENVGHVEDVEDVEDRKTNVEEEEEEEEREKKKKKKAAVRKILSPFMTVTVNKGSLKELRIQNQKKKSLTNVQSNLGLMGNPSSQQQSDSQSQSQTQTKNQMHNHDQNVTLNNNNLNGSIGNNLNGIDNGGLMPYQIGAPNTSQAPPASALSDMQSMLNLQPPMSYYEDPSFAV